MTDGTIPPQFIGILPNKILDAVFGSVSDSLHTLLPASELALVQQIEESIRNVVATLSGSSSQALIQAGDCYTTAIQQQGNTSAMNCFAAGALATLQTAQIGVVEQFVGVLPGALIHSVESEFSCFNHRSPGLTV